MVHIRQGEEQMKKKCKTCVGYGLWGIGEPSPMGKRDSYIMPAKKCPECGAGINLVSDKGKNK